MRKRVLRIKTPSGVWQVDVANIKKIAQSVGEDTEMLDDDEELINYVMFDLDLDSILEYAELVDSENYVETTGETAAEFLDAVNFWFNQENFSIVNI
jgi:hypothetical protein